MARTMYMHTLDGKPAAFTWLRERREGKVVHVPYIHFAGGRHPAVLVPSLRRLRYEQRITQRACASAVIGSEWADPRYYDYVRVKVSP